MRDVVELVDAVDLAIGRAGSVVVPEAIAELTARAASLRNRRGFIGESLVIAVAGGTGSGKSSLVNAVAGEPIASVSHFRPHTDEPLAWIPENAEPGLLLLIDELEVWQRISQTVLRGVALVDLPDMDSIAQWHRRTVEELLPKVDGVLWMLDPEKYRDEMLHNQFLRPLSEYRRQFLFVLNKIDRLADDDVKLVAADLREALAEDGFPDPDLFLMAADPEHGPPRGVDQLVEHLRLELDAKRLATDKLITDAEHLLRSLGGAAGVWEGGGVGLAQRWERVRGHAAEELGKAPSAAGREEALCHIEDLVAALAVEVGEGYGARVRARMTTERIESAVDAAAERARARAESRRTRRWRRSAGNGAMPDAAAVLEEEIGRPLRDLLWDRARLGATIAFASVGARQLRARLTPGEPPEATG